MFFWSGEGSVFNNLGRFAGLGDEMSRDRASAACATIRRWQVEMALAATAHQLTRVATGEGVVNTIWHTYWAIEKFAPSGRRRHARRPPAARRDRICRDQPHSSAGRAGVDAAAACNHAARLLMLVLLVAPSVLLGDSLVSGARNVVNSFQSGELHIPPPPDSVAGWPLIGEPIAKAWTLASEDLEAALRQTSPLLKGFGSWLLGAAGGAGLALLQFVLAILIAGALLANSEAAGRATRAVAKRLAGERGLEFASLAEQTVRSVASGILGVALIQALLAGLGFLVAGVPAAGLLTLICLVFGVIQLGVVIVLIPVVIYLFSTADMVTAVGFLIWAILVAPVDNILKPILLGRGVDVPMLIIFVGAIGGFLSAGIIGLFTGAVVLALGYKLFLAWLAQDSTPETAVDAGEPEIK